jgi:hypothetical protein
VKLIFLGYTRTDKLDELFLSHILETILLHEVLVDPFQKGQLGITRIGIETHLSIVERLVFYWHSLVFHLDLCLQAYSHCIRIHIWVLLLITLSL